MLVFVELKYLRRRGKVKKLFFVLVAVALIASCSKNKDKEVLAVVKGERITLRDLKAKHESLGEQLFRLEENIYKVKEYYLNDVIDSKLIEMEAKSQKISPAELVKKEVSSKIRVVTDEEAAAFAKGKIPDKKFGEYKDRIKM